VQGGQGGAGLGRVARFAVQLPGAHLADALRHRRHRRYDGTPTRPTRNDAHAFILIGVVWSCRAGEATVVDYVLSMAHHDWEGCTGNLAQVSNTHVAVGGGARPSYPAWSCVVVMIYIMRRSPRHRYCAQTLEREAWKDGVRDGWGGRDVRG